jgi:F-type H+-transporting ATPase subunit b
VQLDWFTVFAQVLNFLVLLAILRVVLYGPVTRVLDARAERVAADLAAADAARAEATSAAEAREAAAEEDARERAARRRAVDLELEDYRSRRLEEAREELAARRAAMVEDLRVDRARALEDLTRAAGAGVTDAVRQVLGELSGEDLEVRAVSRFVERLGELTPANRAALEGELAENPGPVEVRTGWPVPEARRGELTAAVSDALGGEVEVEFLQDPKLVCGVELRVGMQAAEWNARAHAEDLELRLGRAFDELVAELDGEPG